MSTLLDEPIARVNTAPAQRLRSTMAAVRVMFTWFGVRKSLTAEQKEQAAESFGAEGQFLSAGKKLLDTRHEAYKAVTAIRGRIVKLWKSQSLPFPEPGIRLIRQDDVASFDVQMTTCRAELQEAVERLDRHYAELVDAARLRLGSLFDPSDYPSSLLGLFGLAWEFPSVEPPPYLRELSPELFRQEQQRVISRFDEAVRLAEEAFATELSRLVSHLAERLSGQEDGRPKVFRDSAIERFQEFFDRFRTLNIRSNADLDALVQQAQGVIRGVEPQELRDSQSLRGQVTIDLSRVQASLDQIIVDRPRRRIIRNAVHREAS
ncbi:MAG: hypothetical protein AB7I37_12165 [Pirellulales bacterium]